MQIMTTKQPEGTFARLMSSEPPRRKPEEAHPEAPPRQDKQRPENVDVHTDARTHTRTDAQHHAGTQTSLAEDLYRRLQTRQRLASSTFRFRPEELEELDKVCTQIKETNTGRMSKNDLVRLGLNWLLEDYRNKGDKSLLAQVLART